MATCTRLPEATVMVFPATNWSSSAKEVLSTRRTPLGVTCTSVDPTMLPQKSDGSWLLKPSNSV